MGSFGGAIARAKTFSLTQVKFLFNNEQKFKYCVTLKRIKTQVLKQKGAEKLLHKNTSLLAIFGPFLFQYFQSCSFSSSVLA